MNLVKGEGFVSLPDDHVLRKDIDWVYSKTVGWQPALNLSEMRVTVYESREWGYANACCRVSDYPADRRQESSEKTEEVIEDAGPEVDSSSGDDSEPFRMQVGWCETKSGSRRYALARVPDSITKPLYPWIVVDRAGSAYTHMDDGRWSNSYNDSNSIIKHLPECTGWDWQPVVRSTKPQVGEWWRHIDGGVVNIIAMTQRGEPIYENPLARVGKLTSWINWQHEPECTGFDWRPQQ